MPIYRVYEVQEEVTIRKWQYEIEADDEDDAIEKAMNGDAEPVEKGTVSEPEYVTWGWASRPAGTQEDVAVWEEALSNLEARRLM